MEWTAESIVGLTVDQVKALRDNAVKRKAQRTVDLCNADLARRSARRTKPANAVQQTRKGEVVHGFHFVCPDEKGLTRNRDGTVWTGTWVVDTAHVERAVKIGAYVALHVAKSEPSYLQGIVRDWRTRERERSYAEGQLVKTKFGSISSSNPLMSLCRGMAMGQGRRDTSMANAVINDAVGYESGSPARSLRPGFEPTSQQRGAGIARRGSHRTNGGLRCANPPNSYYPDAGGGSSTASS